MEVTVLGSFAEGERGEGCGVWCVVCNVWCGYLLMPGQRRRTAHCWYRSKVRY